MVVLAASIVTKTGKGNCFLLTAWLLVVRVRCALNTFSCNTALVSRQYVDMSRIRIEGLLAAFPKLIGSGRQHTYVETENVRYVYQPLEVSHLTS